MTERRQIRDIFEKMMDLQEKGPVGLQEIEKILWDLDPTDMTDSIALAYLAINCRIQGPSYARARAAVKLKLEENHDDDYVALLLKGL